MVFRLYTGTSQFWTETRSVSVNQGIFNVLLGSVNAVATIPESDPCSLEILVEGVPIVPKVRLVSLPFAYNANKSHDVDDGAITNPKLALNAVTSDRIMDGSVQTADLAPNAVTTDKILDGGVQASDLAFGAVTNPKLGPNAVTTDKISDGTVADIDLSASGVAPGTYSLATVTVNNKGRVTAASSGSVSAGVTSVGQGIGIVLAPEPNNQHRFGATRHRIQRQPLYPQPELVRTERGLLDCRRRPGGSVQCHFRDCRLPGNACGRRNVQLRTGRVQ